MARDDWTDFNRSDPGITLLELFAYLADVVDYYNEATAAEQRLRSRRFALAGVALSSALFVWWRRKDDSNDD